jgi:hypothetical protein
LRLQHCVHARRTIDDAPQFRTHAWCSRRSRILPEKIAAYIDLYREHPAVVPAKFSKETETYIDSIALE